MKSGARLIAVLLFLSAALSFALGIFYITVDTNFLADDFGRHITHALAAIGLGIVLVLVALVALRSKK